MTRNSFVPTDEDFSGLWIAIGGGLDSMIVPATLTRIVEAWLLFCNFDDLVAMNQPSPAVRRIVMASFFSVIQRAARDKN